MTTDIDFAHIVPTAYLQYLQIDFSLVLPQMLITDRRYAEYFITRNPSHYTILDNGAAEKVSISLEALIACAQIIGADEVAMPDVLGDCRATITQTEAAIRTIQDYFDGAPPFKIGIVAQGTCFDEAMTCATTLVDAHPSISVIYIPRLLVASDKRDIRVKLAQALKSRYPHIDIHLFGMHQKYSGELQQVRAYRKYIRSIDSSAAACHAEIGLMPDKTWKTTPVVRPKGFFNKPFDPVYFNRLVRYINLLDNDLNR